MKKDQNTRMRILKWIAFLPAAAIVGLIGGKLGDILGVLVFHGKNWAACLFSGFLAAGFFILVGLKVAPFRNSAVKWTLIALCLTFGVISIIGGFLSNEPVSAFAGFGMIVAALAFFAMRPQTVQNNQEHEATEQDPARDGQ
jgi:hypothetical protein